jgi:hypothetical protein
MSLANVFGGWRAERGREARARHYVAAIMSEPDPDAVRSLAAAGDGDEDHARWELRYARRAIGLIVAERDALNDLTGSDVAAALDVAHRGDARIAPDRRAVSERQLNERLREYRAALADRTGHTNTAQRLGRVLVKFANASAGIPLGTELASAIIGEANQVLRDTYGEASLPDDVKPSELG